MGGTFGVSDVTVVNKPGTADEIRRELQAHVQSAKAFFDIDAPIWKGDEIHTSDPRGGTRILYVTDVKINDVRKASGLDGMSHIVASFTDESPRPASPKNGAGQIFNGPVVMISGGQASVAWDGGSANIQAPTPIAEGYEELATTLTKAIALLAKSNDIDSYERELGDEAAKDALFAITTPDPDQKRIKRALAVLRGVLTSAVGSASGVAAAALVEALVIQ